MWPNLDVHEYVGNQKLDLNHSLEAAPCNGDPLGVRADLQVLQTPNGGIGVRQGQVGCQLSRVERRQNLDKQPPGDEQDPGSSYKRF